jgi:predicted dehydrogenase
MKIRTAVLGFGRSGSGMHAGALAANAKDFEVVAVCDADAGRRDEARKRFGCAVYDEYAPMLRQERPELVCVLTRSDQHGPMACDCLAAGAHVLVTKPWALNAAEARRMIRAAGRAGRQLLPWLPVRWGADLLRLRELVSAGTIGRVFLVRRLVSCFSRRSDWQTQRKFGGGYLLNWGPHILDSAVQLKSLPVRSVYAAMRQTLNPGDTEDLFLAVLTLADGTLITAEHTIAVEGLPDWVIQGDAGTVFVHGPRITIHRHTPTEPRDPTAHADMKASAPQTTVETVSGAAYGDEAAIYAEVARSLRGGKPFAVQPADALELTRLLDAVRASSRANRVVRLREGP